jgi:hypothetical protein
MSQHSKHDHEKHQPAGKRTESVLNVGVCNDFHGSPGDQVNFSTPSSTTTCNITQSGGTWPFTDGPPLQVPPAGKTTYIKSNLPNAVYPYEVDCCTSESQKTLTIP